MSSDLALLAFRAMAEDSMQGGTVTYGGIDYSCSVGVFQKRFDLAEGGLSPNAQATVEVYLPDFPDGTEFRSLQDLTVTKTNGIARACQIQSVTEMGGGLFQLEVKDLNQGA